MFARSCALVLSLGVAGGAFAQDRGGQPAECVTVDQLICARSPVAALSSSAGQVQVVRDGSASAARPQTGLAGGDRVQVGQASSAVLALSNACRLNLPSETVTTIVRRENLLCVAAEGGLNPLFWVVGGGALLLLGGIALADDGGSTPRPVSP